MKLPFLALDMLESSLKQKRENFKMTVLKFPLVYSPIWFIYGRKRRKIKRHLG